MDLNLKHRVSRSKKAGLNFPVSRIERYLRKRFIRRRLSSTASVYLASTLEYLTAEILELSGYAARGNKKRRILPRHIFLAISNDEELQKALKNIIIPSGGVRPNLHPSLLPPEKKPKKVKSKKPSVANHNLEIPCLFASPVKSRKQLVQSLNNATEKARKISHVNKSNWNIEKSKNDQLAVYNFEESDNQMQSLNPFDGTIVFTGEYKILLERTLGSYTIDVIEGNIFKVPADAIINPVNSEFYMRSQIGKMLQRKGGKNFKKMMQSLRMENAPLKPSDAFISLSIKTSAKYVIHCNMPFENDMNAECELKRSIINCLTLASKKNMKVLILPIMGDEQSGHALSRAVKVNVEAVSSYFSSTLTSLAHLSLVTFNADSLNNVMDEVCRL